MKRVDSPVTVTHEIASVTDQTRPGLLAREPGSSANLVQRAALAWADAPEALAVGLVTHLADTPRDAALEFATTIAGHDPAAVRAAKQLLNRAYGGRQELLLMESALQDELRAGRKKPR